jgi:hypothetical protein
MATRKELILRERQFRQAFGHNGSVDLQTGFAYFARTFVKIQHADTELPFVLRDSQSETVRHLALGEDIIVLKARQVGFSTLFAAWALYRCLLQPSYSVLFLSRNREEAVYLLSKAKFAYSRLPAWLKERLPKVKSNNEQKMIFTNHSTITSLPSRKDAARGRTTSLLIADEFASLEDQEEAWAAMLPATSVGGQAVVLSTAKGSGDLFETLWNKATTKAMKWTPLFWSWRSAFDQDWYDQKCKELLPWQLAQEHPDNAEEAFVKSGNAVFDLDKLKAMTLIDPLVGEFNATAETFRAVKDGPFRVWETPEPKVTYVIGVDIAEGLEHGDRSVAVVLRADTGEVAAIYSCRVAPWEFAQITAALGRWYNTALIGPERNNHGHAFIRSLVEESYFPIFRHHRATARREQETDELGWLTTPKTKAYLISEFGKFMEDHNIPDAVTIAECKTYKRNEMGKMGGSPFDDHVMAYAIAVEMTNHAHLPMYRPRSAAPPPPWSFGWFERKFGGQSEKPRKIGDRQRERSST